MILSELNANTTVATRIKSFSLDQRLWVCQKGCHTIATERAEWWRRGNFGAIIYLAKYDKEETYSEIEKGSSNVFRVWGLRSVLCFLPWGGGLQQGNLGASSCTDLQKHPDRSHSTMMSLGRCRGMGIYNLGSRVHKPQMCKHGENTHTRKG